MFFAWCLVQQAVEGRDEPVIEHGTLAPNVDEVGLVGVGIERPGAGTTTEGLTPALLISNEPSGIPVEETAPGDLGNVMVADEPPLPEAVSQAVELASDEGPIPPPSKVALVPDMPVDELPPAEHVVPLPVGPIVPVGAGLRPGESSPVAPNGMPVPTTGMLPVGPIVPVGAGLRPGEESPVAPNGIPVPATGMFPETAS